MVQKLGAGQLCGGYEFPRNTSVLIGAQTPPQEYGQMACLESEPFKKPSWGLIEVCVVIAIDFVLRTRGVAHLLLEHSVSPDLLMYLLAALFITYVVLWRKGKFAEFGITRRNLASDSLWAGKVVSVTMGTFIVIMLALFVVLSFAGTKLPVKMWYEFRNSNDFLNYLISFVLLAPVLEETIYRGIAYPPLRKRFGRIPSMVTTGVLFSFAHIVIGWPWAIFPATLLGGVILSWALERRKSLLTPVLIHAGWNLCMGFFSLLVESAGFGEHFEF